MILDNTQSTVCCCAGHKFTYFSADHRISVTTSDSCLVPFVCVCVCVCVWPKTQLAYRQPLKPGPLILFLSYGKIRKNFICTRQRKIKQTERRLYKNMYMYSVCTCTVYVYVRVRICTVYVYVQCDIRTMLCICTVYVHVQCIICTMYYMHNFITVFFCKFAEKMLIMIGKIYI